MARFGTSTDRNGPPISRGGWLDALRFVVAFMMILHHYQLAAPIPLSHFHPVFERGYLLTNFFLIDSGYVLARVYGDKVGTGGMSPLAFFAKRILRVVPAHLIMSLGLVALVGGSAAFGLAPRHPEWFDWSQWPAQFFLVQAYGVPGGMGWNAPSWSLSALLGCYLTFPWLLRALGRASPWSALAIGALAFLLCNLATWAVLGYPVYQMPMKYGFLRALPLFVGGVALARFAHKVYLPPRLAAGLGIAAVAALIGVQALGRYSIVSLALIGVIIIAAGAIPVRRKSALVERAALISFSMFITNEVVRIGWFGVVNVVQARFPLSPPLQWALWIFGVMLALVFAVAFHYLIDMPSQKWLAAWMRRRAANSAMSVAPIAGRFLAKGRRTSPAADPA
ncbi:MAG: acyltransferase [Caulobacteraceae bacterium]